MPFETKSYGKWPIQLSFTGNFLPKREIIKKKDWKLKKMESSHCEK
jgi:hypothetical protein